MLPRLTYRRLGARASVDFEPDSQRTVATPNGRQTIDRERECGAPFASAPASRTRLRDYVMRHGLDKGGTEECLCGLAEQLIRGKQGGRKISVGGQHGRPSRICCNSPLQ